MVFVDNIDGRQLAHRDSKSLIDLQLLPKYFQESLSSQYIVYLLDSFLHQRRNGIHRCLVFELLGAPLTRFLGTIMNLEKDCRLILSYEA